MIEKMKQVISLLNEVEREIEEIHRTCPDKEINQLLTNLKYADFEPYRVINEATELEAFTKNLQKAKEAYIKRTCSHDWHFVERLDRCDPVLVVYKCSKCGETDEEEED